MMESTVRYPAPPSQMNRLADRLSKSDFSSVVASASDSNRAGTKVAGEPDGCSSSTVNTRKVWSEELLRASPNCGRDPTITHCRTPLEIAAVSWVLMKPMHLMPAPLRRCLDLLRFRRERR